MAKEKVKTSREDYSVGKFNRPVVTYNLETVMENGIYVKKEVASEVNPSDNFRKFKTDDLSINHLAAVGAVGMLQDCGSNFSGGLSLDDIDRVASTLPVDDVE